ncbi:AAA family ATPase [Naasia sp. SYSU D00057]|uniref:nSTAND1 domain-containing NTPase n=1 Tax=Naasia sp. SYSU D00057 TaxID=2817380 RepID=UPI001B315F89|nr:AAA family ATPase [Naasia sp. SYSU D00057]
MPTRTFLFVDQVSSTEQLTLLGDHAAQEVRRLLFTLLRRVIEITGGHEVDFTGDGLFCAFEGAAEGVDAAVLMQEVVVSFNRRYPPQRQLAIRIGMNAGEPLTSEGGGYFGAAVVVAARLCAAAGSGQILVSDIVRTLAEPQGISRFDPVGSLPLKGIATPIPAFSVVWTPDGREVQLPDPIAAAVATDGTLPPLLGRKEELRAAAQAWEAVWEGNRRLVLIGGEPGVGVTRLSAEIAARFVAGRATVWFGAALGKSSRFAPWSRALADWAEAVPRAEVRLAVGTTASPLLRLAPVLRQLLPRQAPPTAAPVDVEAIEIADAIDDLVVRWSEHEPIAIVLDDLDDVDPPSLVVLRRLLESTRAARLLVIAGYHTGHVGSPAVAAAVAQLAGIVNLRLQRLSPEDTDRLVRSVTGDDVDSSALRAIRSESEGNPSFALRLAIDVRERLLTRRAEAALGRAEGLRGDLRAQRDEIAEVVHQLQQLREEERPTLLPSLDGRESDPADPQCPYKGLAAYQPEDAADFFGRELLIAELVAKLGASRFLAVVGPSGSGKSSVVRAGLVPALAREALPGSSEWVPVITTPGRESLAASLQRARAEAHGQRVALIVDQFEELWTTSDRGGDGDGQRERAAALDLLLRSLNGDGDTAVVVAMRADYYGRAAEHPALAAAMSESQVLVPPMTAAELHRAIEAPARRAGLLLERGLADAAIADVGDAVGRLPLLSTAMLETWRRRRGRSMTLAGYAEAGGARQAIATLAEDTFALLTDDEQDAARRILLRLADPRDEGGDVARVAPLGELGTDDVSRRLLDRLAERRLVTVSSTTAQVTHEALLREWPRLRDWLDADRIGRRLHHQVAEQAREWEATDRDSGALLRGTRLSAALEWAASHQEDVSALEREYLAVSEQHHLEELVHTRRQLRRSRVLSSALVLVLVGALVALGFGVAQQRDALARANESAAIALATQAIGLSGVSSDTSLLLAVEAYGRHPSLETEGGLLAALDGARHRSRSLPTLPSGIADMALSPDRTNLFIATSAGEVRRADTASWELDATPLVEGMVADFPTITLSPDGRLLAYFSNDAVYVISAVDGSSVAGPLAGETAIDSFDFTSDSQSVAIASFFPTPAVHILDLSSGAERATIPAADGAGQVSVAANPTAAEVAIGTTGGVTLQRYRLDGTPIEEVVEVPRLSGIVSLKYSPDGTKIAARGFSGDAVILDAVTLLSSAEPFAVPNGQSVSLGFAPDSQSLVLSGIDGSARVVDTDNGEVLAILGGMSGSVAAEYLDERRVVLASPNATAAEFDPTQRTTIGVTSERGDPRSPDYFVWSALPEPSGRTILLIEHSGISRLSSSTLRQDAGPLQAFVPGMREGDLSPDGSLLAIYVETPDYVTQLALVDPGTGQLVELVDLSTDGTHLYGAPAISPDGRRIAIPAHDGELVIVDIGSDSPTLSRTPIEPGTMGVEWAPDGSTLFAWTQSGDVTSVDSDTGAVLDEIQLSGTDLTDLIAGEGSFVIGATSSGTVHRADVVTSDKPVEVLTGDGNPLTAVGVSPGGERIAALGQDGALRLWDADSRIQIGPPIRAHGPDASHLVYLSDGGMITLGAGGTVISWNLEPESWVGTACRLVGRDMSRAEWAKYLPDEEYQHTCSDR